ncbi:hypothetical protein [Nocardia sp. NPDC051570]|uniref:hypothetical protein n=1 Tax=Nocardia sp. NPDC051570 TaxID=3364324 RepID=UPI0037A688E5
MIVSKRFVSAVAAAGALSAVVALAAPQAGAAVTSLDIASGLSFGSSGSYGTGCSYAVTVTATPGATVILLDGVGSSPTEVPFHGVEPVADESGKATATWTPTEKGMHYIWATERLSGTPSLTEKVTVGTGIALGPACVVLP